MAPIALPIILILADTLFPDIDKLNPDLDLAATTHRPTRPASHAEAP